MKGKESGQEEKSLKKTLNKLILTVLVLMIGIPISEEITEASQPDDIQSEAYIVLDASTGKILGSRAPRKEKYPASLTKILTALVVIEHTDLNEKVTISEKATHADGTRVYLVADEEVTVEQLLYGIMISSGNDASIALAEHVAGSVKDFSDMMNEYMKEKLQLYQTNFSNPHGLFEEEHKTSAYDLGMLMKHALENETYRTLAKKTEYKWDSSGWNTTIYNHHPMRHFDEWTIAGKNGYVSKAGFTLTTAGKQNDTELIVVTLDAPSKSIAVRDTRKLFDHHFDKFETIWMDVSPNQYSRFIDLPKTVPVTALKNETVRQSTHGEILIHRGTAGRLLAVDRIGVLPSLSLNRPVNSRNPTLSAEDLTVRYVYEIE